MNAPISYFPEDDITSYWLLIKREDVEYVRKVLLCRLPDDPNARRAIKLLEQCWAGGAADDLVELEAAQCQAEAAARNAQ